MVKYDINSNLTVKKIQDEVFVFDRALGIVHTFNTTGMAFWEKLSSRTPFEGIVDEIVNEFDASKDVVTSDLFDFMQQLEAKRLLSIQE